VNQRVRPFLMFEGKAEEAMNFYVSLLPHGEIIDVVRYGPGQAGVEGSIMKATFSIAGQSVMCIDSPVKHGFTFTRPFRCSSTATQRMRFVALPPRCRMVEAC
jgi:predicted 3-demethylubiquinone-9 3-methyltransferase (glyoxalase superfamily)